MTKLLWTYLKICWYYMRYGQKYPIADPNGPVCGIYDAVNKKIIFQHHKPDLELEKAVLGTKELLEKMEKYR